MDSDTMQLSKALSERLSKEYGLSEINGITGVITVVNKKLNYKIIVYTTYRHDKFNPEREITANEINTCLVYIGKATANFEAVMEDYL
jgi:hypothetical protein